MARPLNEILGGATAGRVQPTPPKQSAASQAGGAIVGGLQAVGGALQKAGKAIGEVVISPLGKAAQTVASTGTAVGGLAAAALTRDKAKKRAILESTASEIERERAIAGSAAAPSTVLGGAGVGAQLASYPIAGSVGAAGTLAGASATALGAVTGGAGGLIQGVGLGLEHAAESGKGVVEAIGQASMEGIKGAAIGAATGYGVGKATQALKPSVSQGFSERQNVIDKAASKDAEMSARKITTKGIGAANKPSGPSQKEAARVLIEEKGWRPGDVDDLIEMSADDASAAKGSAEIAERIRIKPSLAAKESPFDPVGDNLFAKVKALDNYNRDLSKGMKGLVEMNNKPLSFGDLDDATRGVMPDSFDAWPDSDRAFYEKVIGRLNNVKDVKGAHEFRQFVANETDQFVASAKGVRGGPGEMWAQKLRGAVGELLDAKVDGYADVRANERVIMDAIDEFDRLVGPKWRRLAESEALGQAATRRGGEIMRRAQGNASANLELTLSKVDEAAKRFDIGVGGDLRKQAYVAGLVEDAWNTPRRTLSGEISKGVLKGQDVLEATTGGAVGKAKVAAKVVGRAFSKAGLGGRAAAEEAARAERDAFYSLIRGAVDFPRMPGPGAASYSQMAEMANAPIRQSFERDLANLPSEAIKAAGTGGKQALTSYLQAKGYDYALARQMADEIISQLK